MWTAATSVGAQAIGNGGSLGRSAAGSAAEQAMVHSAIPPCMSCFGAWSGQCCIGIAA
jgi:hypothetical protein